MTPRKRFIRLVLGDARPVTVRAAHESQEMTAAVTQ